MRFRLGVLTGFAGGYYLGAKAGRERYEQLKKALGRVRRHDAVVAVTDKTRAVVEDKVEVARSVVEDKVDVARDKAQDLVENRRGNGQSEQTSPLP